MIRGTLLKVSFGLIAIIILVIVVFSQKSEETVPTVPKTKLTDFSVATPVDQVETFNYFTNFKIILDKGLEVSENDVLYVVRDNVSIPNKIKSKYVFTQEDVSTLDTADLFLSLSCVMRYEQINATYSYYLVKQADTTQFETLFNKPTSQGITLDLSGKQDFLTIDLSGAISDSVIKMDEHDANNEKFIIILLQNQKYTISDVITVVAQDGTVLIEKQLTEADVNRLHHQNHTLVLDFASQIDSIQEIKGVKRINVNLVSDNTVVASKAIIITIL